MYVHYSLHKNRPFIEPMIVIGTDGYMHIIGVILTTTQK